jgi:hypothetical protein
MIILFLFFCLWTWFKFYQNPDPHSSKMLDPDLHIINADPKHCSLSYTVHYNHYSCYKIMIKRLRRNWNFIILWFPYRFQMTCDNFTFSINAIILKRNVIISKSVWSVLGFKIFLRSRVCYDYSPDCRSFLTF